MACLAENVVVELVLGRASPEVRAEAEGHLDTCPTCRRLVAEMAKASVVGPPVSGSSEPPDPNEPPVPENPRARLVRGTAVGRYVILGTRGAGGVGVVYAAFDPELDRKVALKLLRADPRSDPSGSERRARLLREAQAMARLSHPNVISVYDVGSYEGRVFIAMELIEGATLTQWLNETKRTWREALQMFEAAGRGLGAAHAAGVVHRDFKPDNVLVRRDGRVVVTDFGLARVEGESERPPSLSTPGPSEPVTVTVSGTMIGTPAYMSPEQYAGRPSDTRTDQFSFCVALYEGLHGERPFDGKTLDHVRSLVTRGIVRAAPADTKVPSWLRRVVVRGLSSDPAARFGSMEEMLAALGHDPRKLWRRAAIGGLAVALVLGGGVASRAAFSPSSACAGQEQRLTGVWDDARRAELRHGFQAAGGPFAEAAEPKVERALDAYARKWLDAREDACLATRVRGEQSERLLDLRMACLDRELAQVDSLLKVFADADRAVVDQAVSAATALPPLVACAATNAMDERVPPPADNASRQAMGRAQQLLARARALDAAAKPRPALEAAKAAVEAARPANFAPLTADAEVELGTLFSHSGDEVQAARAFDEGVWDAERGRHDEARVRAWTGLQRSRRLQGKLEEADEAAGHAAAVLSRLGPRPDLDADRLDERGLLREEQGRLEEALTDVSRAQALRDGLLPSPHPLRAESLGHVGQVLALSGRDKDALAAFEQALAQRKELFPENHPEVARSQLDVSDALAHLGRAEEAVAQARQALAALEGAYGPDHPAVAEAAFTLAGALLRIGHREEAEAAYRRAVTLWTVWRADRHPRLVTSYARLGALDAARGKSAEAEREFRRALEVADQALPPDHPARVEPLIGLAQLQHDAHHYAGEVDLWQRALTLSEGRPALAEQAARAQKGLHDALATVGPQ